MPDTVATAELSPAKFEAYPTMKIPLDLIAPDPAQPRKHFDAEALHQLAESIKANGVIQPIVVRPAPLPGELDISQNGIVCTHWIIAGERRWRASRLAGKTDIPATIRDDLSDADVSVLQILENLQRADLTLPETIRGCSRLVAAIGLAKAAAQLGMSEAWVSQRATLADASEPVRKILDAGQLDDVEIAHIIETLRELDAEAAEDIVQQFAQSDIGNSWDRPPTRQEARQILRDAKAQKERERQRLAEEARQTALKERAAAEAKAKSRDLPLGDLPPVPAPPKNESKWDKERRLRAEAWVAREPEMRKIARESKKLILTALEETIGNPERLFVFHVGMRDNFSSYDVPAKASAGELKLEVRGHSNDAGLVMDALAPNHEIAFHVRVPIAKLRLIEEIVGEPIHFTEYLTATAGAVAVADSMIRKIHGERKAAAAPASDGLPDADHVARFLKERTRKLIGSRLKAQELYNAYKTWCGEKGFTPIAFVHNDYGHAIAAAGIEKVRSNGIRYLGIALKPDA